MSKEPSVIAKGNGGGFSRSQKSRIYRPKSVNDMKVQAQRIKDEISRRQEDIIKKRISEYEDWLRESAKLGYGTAEEAERIIRDGGEWKEAIKSQVKNGDDHLHAYNTQTAKAHKEYKRLENIRKKVDVFVARQYPKTKTKIGDDWWGDMNKLQEEIKSSEYQRKLNRKVRTRK